MPYFYLFLFPLMIGMIVTGWQGFKDTPWENFVLQKYVRSYIVAFILTLVGFFLIDNFSVNIHPGIFFLLILGFERAIGDIYKGFFRKQLHPEFEELFKRFHISQLNRWHLRLLFGLVAVVLGVSVISLILFLTHLFLEHISPHVFRNVLAGLIGGSLSATGGAIKDSQFEGFKIKKFIRSPFVGALGGIILGNFEARSYLLVLSIVGFERLVVEFYKTFLTRQVRGIFDGKEIKYKNWMEVRYLFFYQYLIGVGFVLYLFIK